MNPAGQALWAITSYFNPMCYRRRLANYRRFRDTLAVPLATIELGFDDEYELGPGDADLTLNLEVDDGQARAVGRRRGLRCLGPGRRQSGQNHGDSGQER